MNSVRTKLLVSIRSAPEASAALAGGADVIDIKEPDRGALGAADPSVWREVLATVARRAPVSAALGELCEESSSPAAALDLAAQTSGLWLAKVGLAGASRSPHWSAHWEQTLSALPPTVGAVAVAYADWQTAAAPSPREVIERGAELGCRYLLLDTFDKSRGNLLDHLPLESLARLMVRAADRGMHVALAGSLTLALLPRVLPLNPALVAVRGAACRDQRQSAIDADKVRRLAAAIADPSIIVDANWPAPAGA